MQLNASTPHGDSFKLTEKLLGGWHKSKQISLGSCRTHFYKLSGILSRPEG
jgi:hypothetical protein